MNDAKGRSIEVGDWIATPNLHVVEGEVREGAVLGRAEEVNEELVSLGDGISYESSEVITLGGYVWHICLDCNTPSPMDMRGGELMCPFCESERMEVDAAVSYYTAAELSL